MNINTDSSLNIKTSDEFSSTLTGFLGPFLIHLKYIYIKKVRKFPEEKKKLKVYKALKLIYA